MSSEAVARAEQVCKAALDIVENVMNVRASLQGFGDSCAGYNDVLDGDARPDVAAAKQATQKMQEVALRFDALLVDLGRTMQECIADTHTLMSVQPRISDMSITTIRNFRSIFRSLEFVLVDRDHTHRHTHARACGDCCLWCDVPDADPQLLL